MKKLVKVLLILVLLFSYTRVNAAAETLKDLKNELAELKAQKAASDAKKNQTQSQINAENNKITNAHAEVEKAENDIEAAKVKIDESNKNITKTKEESNNLLIFYQMINNDESLLGYITDSSSMTELVMRLNAISQIIGYNQDKLQNLENQILENKQLQVDLTKKEQELEVKIKEYEKSVASLKNDLSSLVEVSLDISQQIRAQQELIDYYEEIGCKDSDKLSVCSSVADSAKWMKPTEKGYISSGFGYRSFYLNGKLTSDYHNAVDIAGNSGGTAIYAAANGTVAAIVRKASCGGNQVYLHVRVKGEAYTVLYAHMMDVYVNVGDKVTQQTVIGSVGGGGKTLRKNGGWDTCSTGYHLHFAVAKGFYLGGGAEGYSSYNKFVSKSITPPNMPAYGKWYYSRY